MSFWSKIRGTAETLFQLGKGGPQLKNNAAVIEARNATDAAFVKVRGADPAAADDLVTKRYGDANYAAPFSGTAQVDFGSSYSNATSVAVTGQAAILSGSTVDAWLVPVATTDHSADEHVIGTNTIEVLAGTIVAGTGFTIYAIDISPGGQYGKYTVAWSWS